MDCAIRRRKQRQMLDHLTLIIIVYEQGVPRSPKRIQDKCHPRTARM